MFRLETRGEHGRSLAWYRKTRDIPFKFGRRPGLYMESLGVWVPFPAALLLVGWRDMHFVLGYQEKGVGVSGKGFGHWHEGSTG